MASSVASVGSVPVRHHPDPASIRAQLPWLIRLRWIAFAGVLLIVVGAHRWGLSVGTRAHFTLALLLGVANVLFTLRVRRPLKDGLLSREVTFQIVFDLIILAGLLHWSDGIENPFAMFFPFQMAIAAKLLRRRTAFALALFATLLQGSVIWGEHTGLLAHHPIFDEPLGESGDRAIGSVTYLAVYLTAFAMTQFGIVYFMQTMAHHQRIAEARRRSLEQLAASRERLAYVGELSAGMAHAIRNPVHGMLNCVDLLRQGTPRDADNDELLSLLDEGLQRVSGLTRSLLVFTRQVPVDRHRVALSDVVRASLAFLELRASAGRGVVVDPSGGDVYADVDVDQMTQALVNVLDNALDACGPNDTVSIAIVAPHGVPSTVGIEVRDTGAGMDEASRRRIFDAFFSTKPVGEGTGLGLAITQRIVQAHGGRVEVKSAVGEGTTVRLLMPVARSFPPADESASPADSSAGVN